VSNTVIYRTSHSFSI